MRIADTFFRLAPSAQVQPKVVVVAIDDESLQRYGRWPWSRTLLARLTDTLAKDGASVVGLDILLSEPQSPVADKTLEEALQSSRAVIVDRSHPIQTGPWMEPLPQFAQRRQVVMRKVA
jgi:adenylate cyclase